jgi:Holliday junction resolvasome RuvABC DNA-binding subunit
MAIPVSSEDVNTLVSMGFSRDEAAQALRAHRGNLNAAADDLLQR